MFILYWEFISSLYAKYIEGVNMVSNIDRFRYIYIPNIVYGLEVSDTILTL